MRRFRSIKGARSALLWGLACYLVAQLAFAFVLYDPEYTSRLTALKARLAENRNRALWLMIGSSRTKMAFRPDDLAPLHTPSGKQVLAFNFSHPGAGPIINLMEVQRLLREGIHPDGIMLELVPAMLAYAEGFEWLTGVFAASDLPGLSHYVPAPELYGRYLWQRLVLEHRHQLDFARGQGHALGVPGFTRDKNELTPLGAPRKPEIRISEEDRARGSGIARSQYAWALEEFKISPDEDRAMGDILALCRREHIDVVLLLTPESSTFRSWYSAGAVRRLDSFLARLHKDCGVPIVDARDWVADRDFKDGHHVLLAGARVFTARLERDVLRPVVQGNFRSRDGAVAAALAVPRRDTP